jgi:DNA-binding HxlR family transcriptional regulator
MCDPMRYPIDESVKVLGRKFAAPVLYEIMSGRNHFSTLLDVIPGVNPKTLSTRLDEFEVSGLISRVEESNGGTRLVRYVLTSKGEGMRYLVREIVSFTMKWHLAR